MEFSFDNQNQNTRSTRSRTGRRPPASPMGDGATSDDGLGSDRLRKAIERNRAKQAKRAIKKKDTIEVQAASPNPEEWSLPMDPPTTKPKRATRRSVARPNDFEFAAPVKKPRRTSPSVGYKTKTTTKRTATLKRKKTVKGIEEMVIKGIWVFCAILTLRLIFSDGGVVDYYSKKSLMEARVREYNSSIEENKGLVKEIDLIKSNGRYQRKLVRDHLGFIAPDEYLILFAEDSGSRAI